MLVLVKEALGFLLAITLIILLAMNLKGCSDVSDLERSVSSTKPFIMKGKEWACKLTDKQNRIDALFEEIQNVRNNNGET